ncbi:similar to Saccharomyces cerevisiae YML025C YML6 Mitochondrial ribosomal protein of the large subunit [Maudiozyma saulgeensis]|uniref:Large ribosomal subunit protein uL4m n=1 Tax=Maudiozyma saulgeensis TaxID=1789683 RepID=A0A1X7QWM5_9SACH|nr:similar to Saccharomyces cerevisiae YML025C YML6 Mitochondrial ribosomal protein of the large subunit [Kazachstania saulgeensis]
MLKSTNIRLNIVRSISGTSKTLPNSQLPPAYTLATLRVFPSLEPLSCIPISTSVLGVPLRRDILWRAVVHENDNRRVGASNPPGRSENGYSRHKILPQKGSGNARVGDANSPTRHKGGVALARNAPNDYTTDLPNKVYHLAFRTALSHQYKEGNLFIIGNMNSIKPTSETDSNKLDIEINDGKTKPNFSSVMFKKFLKEHEYEGKRLLFITSDTRPGLLKYTDMYKNRVDVVQQEGVEVNDLLKASKIFIEEDALKYLAEEFTALST